MGSVLWRRDYAAAAHTSEFIFEPLDYRGLGAADAGEESSKLECGDLQHEAPVERMHGRCAR